MILNKLSVVAVLAVGMMAVGCKSKCEEICELEMDCDYDERSIVVAQDEDDCSDECEEAEETIDAADCGDEYDSYYECVKDLDICDAEEIFTECEDERDDFLKCIEDYCGEDDAEDIPGECT